MSDARNVYNLGELRANLGSVVKRAVADPDHDYLIAEHGHPIAAIVSLEELRRLRSIAEASAAGLSIITDESGRPNIVLDERAVAYFHSRAKDEQGKIA